MIGKALISPQTDAKEHCKQVEMPGLMGPEEQRNGQPLQAEAQAHGNPASHPVGQDRDGEAREGADAGHRTHY